MQIPETFRTPKINKRIRALQAEHLAFTKLDELLRAQGNGTSRLPLQRLKRETGLSLNKIRYAARDPARALRRLAAKLQLLERTTTTKDIEWWRYTADIQSVIRGVYSARSVRRYAAQARKRLRLCHKKIKRLEKG